MISFLKHTCLLFLISSPLVLAAANKQQMLEDLDNIKSAFRTSYAPADWKRQFSEWDLNLEMKKAKASVMESSGMSTKEFQRVVKKFLNSTKDYHVGVRFYSTEKASLHFRVKSTKGRYFISYIDEKRLSSKTFPFSVGDELILFDDRPVDEVVKELRHDEINSNEQTDQALAEARLTHRSGKLGNVVPKGTVSITVLPKGCSQALSYQLIWDYSREKIGPFPKIKTPSTPSIYAKSLKKPVISKNEISKDPIFNNLLLAPYFDNEELDELEDDDDKNLDFIGARDSFIPILGRLWWATPDDSPFNAYLFELSNHKLAGYIRIPSYMPSSFDDIEEFAKIISFMEDRSEALVIDQVDNPGGSLFYLYALASMLTEQSLVTPRHRIALTQANVYAATQMIPLFESISSDTDAQSLLGKSFLGIPVSYQLSKFFLNYFHFIVDEWNAGRQITEPYFLYGIDHINPSPDVRYTKPILILVNSLAFSGGDFFPAILQDNHRAKIMGSRTAGAGGFVTRVKFPNLNGIAELRLTGSIAERSDKNPIENLGVTPDIFYELTENDLRFDYEDYAEAICNELLGLIKDK